MTFICDMCEVKQFWWDSQKLAANLFALLFCQSLPNSQLMPSKEI